MRPPGEEVGGNRLLLHLRFADSEDTKIATGKDDPETVGVEKAAGLFQELYGASYRPEPVVIDREPRSKRRAVGPGKGDSGG